MHGSEQVSGEPKGLLSCLGCCRCIQLNSTSSADGRTRSSIGMVVDSCWGCAEGELLLSPTLLRWVCLLDAAWDLTQYIYWYWPAGAARRQRLQL